ncbi:MAG: hypothetical protein RLZZ262_1357 [Bacteroidota bacterium]|jgi:hypothetical protein
MVLAFGCKKSVDYVPEPYMCNCGTAKWQGKTVQLLDVNYILVDSTVSTSRRYYLTANVKDETEIGVHTLSAWIEVPDVSLGPNFEVDLEPDSGEPQTEFKAWIDELNVNDPIDSLRSFVPVNGVLQIGAAPATGGTERVNFIFTMNEVDDDGDLIDIPVLMSGSFAVSIRD